VEVTSLFINRGMEENVKTRCRLYIIISALGEAEAAELKLWTLPED
jgi:hypothetical protein